MRILGWIGLVASLILYMNQQGNGVGLIFWIGMLTVSALIQVIVLAYKPQKAIAISLAILILGIILLIGR